MLEQVVHMVTTLLGIIKFGKYMVDLHEVTFHVEVSLYYQNTVH